MANGNFGGGTGTASDPYLIEDAFDLNKIRNNLSAHYKLINDIDLDISPFNENLGWNAIAFGSFTSVYFTGVLDGNNHMIKNMKITRNDTDNTRGDGLFGNVSGNIKNLGLVNISIKNGSYNGGICSYLLPNGIIENCFVTGQIDTKFDSVGGICSFIIGGTIKNCWTNVNIISSLRSGGIAAVIEPYNSSIPKIINSYSISKLQVGSNPGGLVAYKSFNVSVTNSFWDINVSNTTSSSVGTGLTTQEMQTVQTYIDAKWDTETLSNGTHIWKLKDGNYPRLWFENTDVYYYATKGTWESPIIDLGLGRKETKAIDILKTVSAGSTDCQIEIATSEDGKTFLPYTPFDSSNLPQTRYLKIKVTLTAPAQNSEDKILPFDQSNPENTMILNDFVEAAGQLKLKNTFTLNDNTPTAIGSGNVYEFTIDKSNFKSIESITVQ